MIDDRRQRRLVARELQQLDAAARRRRVGVDQRDRVELVQQLVAGADRIVRPGDDQADAGQQPVEPLDHLVVGVDDQDLLPGGGGLIRHGATATYPVHAGFQTRLARLVWRPCTKLGHRRRPRRWTPSSTGRWRRRASWAPRTFTSNRGCRRSCASRASCARCSDVPPAVARVPAEPGDVAAERPAARDARAHRRRHRRARRPATARGSASTSPSTAAGIGLSLRLIPPEVAGPRQAGAARRGARAGSSPGAGPGAGRRRPGQRQDDHAGGAGRRHHRASAPATSSPSRTRSRSC